MWTQVEDQQSEQYEDDSSSSSSSMMAGALHVDQCLVPPGYMLPNDGGDMVECATGTYKEVGFVTWHAAAGKLLLASGSALHILD
jgi:hypothetical protein